MALKNILNTQDAFTGEFPAAWAPDGLWRFNESEPDEMIIWRIPPGRIARHIFITGAEQPQI